MEENFGLQPINNQLSTDHSEHQYQHNAKDHTHEQKKILLYFRQGKNILINAFAGSGKTTMLRMITEYFPQKKFLIFCFNKKNADEIKEKFSKGNMIAKTTHAFCRYLVRKHLLVNSIQNNSKILIKYLKDYLNISFHLAHFLHDVFIVFCHKVWPLTKNMLIHILISDEKLYYTFRERKNFTITLQEIITYLERIWKGIEQWELPLFHDFYMKYVEYHFDHLFADQIPHYDAVMLDEAQDTNPVFIEIFKKLAWQKVVVGDKHQSIYARRHAINAMEIFAHDPSYVSCYLSYSFRFPEIVAQQANHILHNFVGETQNIVSYYKEWLPASPCSQTTPTIGHIFRGNVGIIYFIRNYQGTTPLNFVRDIKDIFYLPLQLEIVKKFYEKKVEFIEDEYLRMVAENFPTWQLFCEYIENSGKQDLMTSLNVVNKIYEGVFTVYQKAHNLKDNTSSYIITTAHTVKWLEFDHIIISDDFPDYLVECFKIMKKYNISAEMLFEKLYHQKFSEKAGITALREEFHLAYIALTRTRKTCHLQSQSINFLLRNSKEQFIQLLSQYKKKNQSLPIPFV